MLCLIQVQEVQRLQDHIGKLRIADAAFQTALYRFLVDHVADVEELAIISQKVDDGDVLGPVQVIDHFKTEHFADLRMQRFIIVLEHFFGEHVALAARFGIPDESGRAAHQHERVMAVIGQTLCRQQAGKVPDVHAVCGRVRADVKRHPAFIQFLFKIRTGDIVNQPTPFQFFKKCHLHPHSPSIKKRPCIRTCCTRYHLTSSLS